MEKFRISLPETGRSSLVTHRKSPHTLVSAAQAANTKKGSARQGRKRYHGQKLPIPAAGRLLL
jgi:hypothetical protein